MIQTIPNVVLNHYSCQYNTELTKRKRKIIRNENFFE